MAEGGQITVGAVAVEIVPSAKNFASSLAAQILPQTAAIAERLGGQFGDKIEKKTKDGIRDGLSGADSEAAAAGEKAAKNFGGAFGRQAKSALKAVEAALPKIEIDAKTTKFDKQLDKIRTKAATLSDLSIDAKLNSEKFLAKIEALRVKIARMQASSTISIDARVNLAEASAAMATLEEKILSANTGSGKFARTLNTTLKSALTDLPDPRLDLQFTGDKEAIAKINIVRGQLLGLRDQRIGIDVSAADALARVEAIRKDLQALGASVTDPRLSLDIKAALASLSTLVTATEAAKQQMEEPVQLELATGAFARAAANAIGGALGSLGGEVDLKLVGDKKAVAAIGEIRTALAGLSDEQIGITISPRDALAQIAIVQGALEALAASVKDPALSVNIAAALKNLATLTAVAEAAKAKIEEPVELKLREGAFTADLRAALAGSAGKIIQIPVDADVSPAEKELGLIGKQMDRLSAKQLSPKFNDADLLAAAERVQKRLEKLTDAAKFGESISYQAREALKGVKAFTDGVSGANFAPKADFKETEVNAGLAARKVQQAFSDVLTGLPDPIITARDNAPEVQKHYEPVYRLLQDISGTKIGLDTPTPAAVKNLRDASDALKGIRGLGRISPELDASLPAFHKAVDDAEHELGTLLGHHPPVEVDADTKPAKRELGSLKSEILSVAEVMQKALGDRFSSDLLGDLPASLKRETADMVKDLAGLNAEKIGNLGAPQALLQIQQTSEALKDLASLPGLNPELANNFRVAGKASDDLLKKVNALHGRDITPELRAQELQASAGSMVQGIAAQFGRLENVFPKIRLDADTTSYTKEIDAIRDQARDLKLTVGVTIPAADAIARAKILHRELKAIFDDPIKQDVRPEAAAGLRETESLLKSVGAEAQTASKGLFAMFDGFSAMTPAAKLANLAAVGFIGVLIAGIPIAAMAIMGLAGLVITVGAALGAAAIGAGVFMLAFSKVTSAIKAREAAQKAAASNAAQDAQTELSNEIARKNATDAITAARKNLDKVTTTAARNARDSALAVTAAQKNLTQAQARETAARTKLNDATKLARVQYKELTLAIKENRIEQQAAIVSVTQSREKYNAILADPTASESDIEAARANYNSQEDGLQKLQLKQQENSLAKAKYDRDGIAGNDAVLSAQTELKNAVDSVADSHLAVTAASTRAREQQIDDANSINDAETALSKARTDRFNLLEQQRLAAAATAATRAETTKDYDTAPPAVKHFADFYETKIKPAFNQFGASAAGSGILTSIENFFTKIQPMLPSINTLITTVGKSVGGLIDDLGDVMSGPEGQDFIAFLKTEVPKAFDLFGKAAKIAGPFIFKLIEKLAPVAEKVGPKLVDMFAGLADQFSKFAAKKGPGGLTDLLSDIIDYAPKVISGIVGFVKIITVIVQALAPFGVVLGIVILFLGKLLTGFGAIGTVLEVAAGLFVAFLLGLVSPVVVVVAAIIAAIYILYKYWDDIWGWIKKAAKAVFDWFVGGWKTALSDSLDTLKEIGGWISDKWDSFTSGLSAGWKLMWDNLKGGARTALDWIHDKFKSAVGLIGKAWSLLKGYFALPIHGFFTIVNGGLISGLNKLLGHFPGKLHIDDVPEPGFIKDAVAGAAKTLGFNRGGVIPGYEPGRDTVPAVLSKGEAVLVPQVTRQIGPAQIEEWNRRGLAGMPIQHFATGTGHVTLKPHVTVAAHAAEPTVVVAKVAQPEPEKPTGLAGRLLSTFTHALEAPVQKFLGAYGDTPLVQGLARMPELFVGKIGSWVTDQIKALGEKVVNAGKSVLGWLGLIDNDAKDTKKPGTKGHNAGVKAGPQAAADYAQSRLPTFGWDGGQMGSLASLWGGESSWRWNATNPDSGAYGIPQALPATKMADAGKDWKTNAFTQINWGLAYIAANYGDPASALLAWQGREPHWYDQGGYLPPGLTLAMNGTGKPEHVFTDDQLRAMREQRNSQVGVVVRVEDGAVPGLVTAEVDRSFGRLADASIYGGI